MAASHNFLGVSRCVFCNPPSQSEMGTFFLSWKYLLSSRDWKGSPELSSSSGFFWCERWFSELYRNYTGKSTPVWKRLMVWSYTTTKRVQHKLSAMGFGWQRNNACLFWMMLLLSWLVGRPVILWWVNNWTLTLHISFALLWVSKKYIQTTPTFMRNINKYE